MSVLEEDCGLATVVMLKNAVPVTATMAQAQRCFPEGSRVAIRDPYLTRLPDGLVGVLVESPTDIVFLSRAVTAKDHCNFTSPSYQESNFVEKSSDEDVRQSPNGIQEASFPVSSDAPQQDDHHEEASVILNADHSNDQSSQQTGEEVEEETLPSVDLDGAAQSEQCHVDRDAVVGGLSGETEEFVSNLAVEDINNEVSASHNVVEGIAPGTCNVDREVIEDADTSKVAETKEVSGREVVEDSNKISFSNNTAQANESESCDIGTADADVEVAGYTATENNSIDDAVEFKEDGDREAVTRVSDVETTKTGEAKEVVSHPTMEECNDVLPSTIVDKVTKGDRCDVETEDTAAVSEAEADNIDEVKEVVSSPGTEDCEIFLPSANLNEAIDEESEDTVGVLEVETEKRDEAKEASSSAATEEWKENLPNTILDEDIDNDRCDGESDEVAGVSEVEGKRSNEEKEILSSSTIEEFNESLPSTSVDATNEDDRCNKASEDVGEVSEVHMENSDELKELASNSTMECNDILPSTTEDEATEDFSHDRESKDTTRALDTEGDKDNETKEIGSSPSTKECNDIVPSTNVDQGTLDNRHDEASDNVVGVLKVEVDKSDEVKEMSNSPTTEEVSEILSNTNADQAIEDERFDKESEDIVEISRLEANKTEHVNKIVSSPSIEECNDNVPNICGDEAIKDDMCVEENEGVARVPDVEATRGDEVKEVESSVAMEESGEIPPRINVKEATEDDATNQECENTTEVSELEGDKSDEVKDIDMSAAIEEFGEIPASVNAKEATEDDASVEECKDKIDVKKLEANKSDEMKEEVDSSVAMESNEIPPSIIVEEATGDEACQNSIEVSELEANKSDEMKEVENSAGIEESNEILQSLNVEEAIEDNVGDEECKDTTEVSKWEADKSDEMKDVERSIAIEESTEISPNLKAEEIIEDDVGDKECKDAIEVSELEANKSDEMKEVENSAGIEESNEIHQSLNVEEAIEDNVGDEECRDTTEVSEWEADKSDEMKDVERNIAIEESTEIPPNINVEETTKDDVDDEECKDAIQVSELEANKSDEVKEIERNTATEEFTEVPPSLSVEEAIEDSVVDEECNARTEVSELEGDNRDQVKEVESSASIKESNEIPQNINVGEAIEDNVVDGECKHTTEVSELETDNNDEMKEVENNVGIEESSDIPQSLNVEEATKDNVANEECKDTIEVSKLEVDKIDEVKDIERGTSIEESSDIPQSWNVEEVMEDGVADEECKDTSELSKLEANNSDEMTDAERSTTIEESTKIHPNINAEETTENDVVDKDCEDRTEVSELEADRSDEVEEVENSVGIKESNESLNVEKAIKDNVGDEECKDTTEVSVMK